jgi:TP901 family phage tail tape measure protein
MTTPTGGGQNLRQSVRELVTLLESLAKAGEITTAELREFSLALNSISLSRFGLQNYDQLIDRVNKLSIALHRAGFETASIEQLRTGLLNLGAAHVQYGESVRNIGAGTTTPLEESIRRTNALFNQLGVPRNREALEEYSRVVGQISQRVAPVGEVVSPKAIEGASKLSLAATVAIRELQKLGVEGRLTEKEFQKLGSTLGIVGTQRLGVENYEQFSIAVNQMAEALQRAGRSATEVQALRRELLQLGAGFGRFTGDPTQIAGGLDPATEAKRRQQAYIKETGGVGFEGSLTRQIELIQVYDTELKEVTKNLERLQAAQAKGGPQAGKGPIDPGIFGKEAEAGLQANKKFFEALPFGARNVGILQERLEKLGLTNARVTRNTTELSTGITTLQFSAEGAGGRIRTFTTHLDRTGTILDDTQKRFRTFGDAIVRDTVEVLKWTVAIGLIYGPLRQLNALMEEAREIQTALAEVQIVTGQTTSALGSIFRAAGDIARETSTDIAGVIDSYSEAFAATGSIESAAKRAATTQALLRDSLVLSKLAGIEQSESLDTLVGALRQANLELSDGIKVIDAWVAVSKNANVSLNQLASTYAIVGTAAEDAGITADQLNAIVGTLAEATKLSADEVGNAIRGFISGFQSSKAEETLARFGIAVRNTRGEVRSFTDLMQELSVLSQEGVLSEREVSEITNVIGGGFRRGAQLAALLENYNRVVQLTGVSERAQGDAAEALQIRMETLDSAIVRLSNSFSELAQTLGQEGGALSVMTGLTNAITGVIEGVTRLVQILGPAAPALAALSVVGAIGRTGTARRYLESQIPAALAYLFSPNAAQLGQFANVAGYRVPPGAGAAGGQVRAAGIQATPTGQLVLTPVTYSQFIGELVRRMNEGFAGLVGKLGLGRIAGLGVGGLITPAIVAGGAALQGDYAKAGVVAGTSFLTAVATGGSAIWTAAGAILAAAFFDTFLTFEGDLTARWAEILVDAQRQAGEGEVETAEDVTARIEAEIRDSLTLWQTFIINSRTLMTNLVSNIQALANRIPALQKLGVPEFEGAGVDVTPQDLVTLLAQRQAGERPLGGGPLEAFLLGGLGEGVLSQEQIEQINELMGNFIVDSIEKGIVATETQQKIVAETEAIEQLAAETAQNMVGEALEDIAQTQAGAIERYLQATQAGGPIALAAANLRVAIERAQETGFDLPVPSRIEAVQIVSTATEEERQLITSLTGDIVTLSETIDALNKKPILSEEEATRLERLRGDLEETKQALENLFPAIERASILREVEAQIKPVIDVPDELTPEQIQLVLERAEQFWTQVLQAFGLSEEQIQVFVESQKEQLVRAGSEIVAATKIPQAEIQRAIQDLGLGADKFSFVDVRDKFAKQDIPQLVERYARLVSGFRQVPGFELKPEQTTLVLEDGFETLHLDMRLWSLLMQDLIDIEKDKGLEGIFNLPEGATFWVPVSAFELDRATRARGAGGGFSGFEPSFFDQFAPDPDAIAEAFGRELEQAGLTEGERRAEEIFGTSIDTLRRIVTERIETPEARERLGVEGPAQFLPVEDIESALRELGVKIEEPLEFDALERIGSEGNTHLQNIYSQLQLMTTDQQITNAEMLALLAITAGVEEVPERPFPQKDELAPFFTPQEPQEVLPFPLNILEPILQPLSEFINSLLQLNQPEVETTAPTGFLPQGGLPEFARFEIPTTQDLRPEPVASPINLQIDSKSQVQLIVDGRILADIIKPYIYEDLLRAEATGSSSIRRSIIA